MKISDKFTKYLELSGQTKSQFALKAGVSRPTLDKVLAGEPVTQTTIIKICKGTGDILKPQDFFNGG